MQKMHIRPQKRSISLPNTARKQKEQREDLKSSCQHIEDQHKLGKHRVAAKIHHRSNALKAGTYVVEASHSRAEIGSECEVVKQRNQQKADKQNQFCQLTSYYFLFIFFLPIWSTPQKPKPTIINAARRIMIHLMTPSTPCVSRFKKK